MRVLADTGPLLAASYRGDPAHALAASLVEELGRDLVVLETVLVEADHLLRRRIGAFAARALIRAVADGEHSPAFLTSELLGRAARIEEHYADLDLGFTDASLMAYAERHGLAILTFDFPHFRAAPPSSGHWRLVVDEARYQDSLEE